MNNRIKSAIPVGWQELYQAAVLARQRAYAPYSSFPVGAAISGKSGEVYTGCNIENASSGLTVCAERVAIWNAIAVGEKYFDRLVVVTEDGSTPCGACRQVLYEFAPELIILIADVQGQGYITALPALLPEAFTMMNTR
jgi:cytidine deaminase